MERENFYILLGLPFDPPVDDDATIKAAIKKKKQEWSAQANNPFMKDAARYIKMVGKIKEVMLDPAKRAQEADNARQIKNQKKAELNTRLKLYVSKGDKLSPRDLKRLKRDFSPYGFTEEEIKDKFNGLSNSQKSEDIGAVLEVELAKNIKKSFKDLGQPTSNFYAFFNLSPSSSAEQMYQVADNLRQKLLNKGEKSDLDSVKQTLAAQAKEIFKDQASKQKYDNYLRLTKYTKFNAEIDDAANINQRVINPKMKDSLLSDALKEYGDQLDLSQASMYLQNYCKYMGYKLGDSTIICGLCGTENSANATVCKKCGKQLVITCPRCGAKNDNATKKCTQCGFDLTKIDAVNAKIDQAKKAIGAKDYANASKLIEEAKIDWPNHPDIAPIEKMIRDFRNGFDAISKSISAAISQKNYYKANDLIAKAQNDGYQISQSTINQVSQAISEAENKISQISSMNSDQAFTALMGLSESIKDSSALNNALKKYPPKVPDKIDAKTRNDAVTIKWSASPSQGNVEYILVRRENAYPNSATDNVVYKGQELTYTDTSVTKAVPVYYGLYVSRAGVLSPMLRLSQPVIVVDPVSDVKAIGSDRIINLSWNCPSTVSDVKLLVYKGETQPQSDDQYTAVESNRLDGAKLDNLINGQRYWIKIIANHIVNAQTVAAAPVVIAAVPQKPVKPLEDFKVTYSNGNFKASWKKTEWDVILLKSDKKPEYAVGEIYTLSDLQKKFDKINLNIVDDTDGTFALNFIGQCYIIPAVISATNVILSKPVAVSNVPKVKNIFSDFNKSNSEIYVSFDWPKNINKSMLIYRTDDYPKDPSDPAARVIDCNIKQYDENAGILVSDPPLGTIYAKIYTYFEDEDGKKIFSEGVKYLIDNEPQRDVYYSFKYKKAGLFSKSSKLTVEINSKGHFVFPKFVIVSKYPTIPLKRDDGNIIFESDKVEINNSYRFEVKVPQLRKGSRLKIFFLNDQNYSKYKIQNNGGSKI